MTGARAAAMADWTAASMASMASGLVTFIRPPSCPLHISLGLGWPSPHPVERHNVGETADGDNPGLSTT